MQRVEGLGTLLVALLFAASATHAQAPLDAAGRSALEEQACTSRHGTKLDSVDVRSYRDATHATAEVRCASHGVYQGKPMHYIVQCSRAQGRWTCEGEWNEIIVPLGDEQLPVRIEGEIPVGVSYMTIQKIASGGTFQGYPLRKSLVAPCYLNKGSAKEFIDVKCEGWHIVVSTWCPQEECPRVFSLTKIGS